jgi:predicted metal-binding protein
MSLIIYKIHTTTHLKCPGVAQCLRRCATSRTVPGWIPGGVTVFFGDISPSDRTMALGTTQPLSK